MIQTEDYFFKHLFIFLTQFKQHFKLTITLIDLPIQLRMKQALKEEELEGYEKLGKLLMIK